MCIVQTKKKRNSVLAKKVGYRTLSDQAFKKLCVRVILSVETFKRENLNRLESGKFLFGYNFLSLSQTHWTFHCYVDRGVDKTWGWPRPGQFFILNSAQYCCKLV